MATTGNLYIVSNVWMVPSVVEYNATFKLPRDPKPYSDVLRSTQRYYETSFDEKFVTIPPVAAPVVSETYSLNRHSSIAPSIDGSHHESVRYRVEKRNTPSIGIYSAASGALNNASSGFTADVSTAGWVTSGDRGTNGFAMRYSGTSATSPLHWHWTADARLPGISV